MAVIYDIKLRISYDYASQAVGGHHIACVMPLEIGHGQRVIAGLIDVSPKPEERTDRMDFFGNRVTEFSFRGALDHIDLTLLARVEKTILKGALHASLPIEQLRTELAECRDLGPESPLHFLAASFRVPRDAAMTAFARAELQAGMTVADAVLAVGHALHRHMKYDTKATTVDTPAATAFAIRQGVCQDFSHIMIACLRGIGIPAGYVSGFLRTLPPPGKPRLEGADAMHAWVRAWCGAAVGWIEFDPTNDKIADADHVVVARGRDYSDVAPIKGTLRISGRQQSTQAVDMVPVEP